MAVRRGNGVSNGVYGRGRLLSTAMLVARLIVYVYIYKGAGY